MSFQLAEWYEWATFYIVTGWGKDILDANFISPQTICWLWISWNCTFSIDKRVVLLIILNVIVGLFRTDLFVQVISAISLRWWLVTSSITALLHLIRGYNASAGVVTQGLPGWIRRVRKIECMTCDGSAIECGSNSSCPFLTALLAHTSNVTALFCCTIFLLSVSRLVTEWVALTRISAFLVVQIETALLAFGSMKTNCYFY